MSDRGVRTEVFYGGVEAGGNQNLTIVALMVLLRFLRWPGEAATSRVRCNVV